MWRVGFVIAGRDPERYRQLARMEKASQIEWFYIELTFFDSLSNLRSVYLQLVKDGEVF